MNSQALSQVEAMPDSPHEGPPLIIGYVLKMFPRFSETFILNEILALQQKGAKVHAFSMKEPNEAIRQPDFEKFVGTLHVIPALRGKDAFIHARCHLACFARSPRKYMSTLIFALKRRSRAGWNKFLCAPFIVARSRSLGIEHFHAHFASGPARQAKLASLISGIPFSFTAHAKDLYWTGHQHGKNNKLKKRVRLASFVVTISEYNREFINSLNFKAPRRRMVTVYNGMDLNKWPFLRPRGLPAQSAANERPLILAVGRLVPKKGFGFLMEACRLLKERGVRFQCAIAGDGPEKDSLLASIAAKGIEDVVTLLGSIPQDRLRSQWYPRAAVLAQPSVVCDDGDQDGIPTVIIEALAVGLPVVSTRVSGIGEAVIDGKKGLLIDADRADELADAIERVISDEELAAHLAAHGRSLIETRFDLNNNMKMMINLFSFSARNVARWSDDKFRERVGLPPLLEIANSPAVQDAKA